MEAPGKVLHPKGEDRPAAAAVQSDVMRFADRFDAELVAATHEFTARGGTTEARVQALEWSIEARTSAITIASGPNPNVALLDMLVFVTLGRVAHEEHWMPDVWGEADQPMVDAYRKLEPEIWEIAKKSFEPKQLDEIRDMIDSWRKDNPAQTVAASMRLADFEHLLASRSEEKKNMFQEIGKMFSLDPLAGLEPAKREMEEARLLGERTLFYAQRAPLIFSSQVELLSENMTHLPAVQDALKKSAEISDAAASMADSAAKLPASIREERKETIEQASEELTRQREGIVRDLATAEAPVAKILEDARSTLDAARETSGAIEGAVRSLDAFVARTNQSSGSSADPVAPGRPFDVREYGAAAARIGEAAKGLDALVQDVDRSVRRASISLLVVGLVLVGAAAAAALAVLRISAQWRKPRASLSSARRRAELTT